MLLLHCLRSNGGISSRPPEEFCEIVFIAFMMSSLVIYILYLSVGVQRSHLDTILNSHS